MTPDQFTELMNVLRPIAPILAGLLILDFVRTLVGR